MTIIKMEYEYGLRNVRTGELNDYVYGYPDYPGVYALDGARQAKRDWERDTGDEYEIIMREVKRGPWHFDMVEDGVGGGL